MLTVRRLAAIFAADVAGYSRLMGADEEGTHERLRAHSRELVDPKISEHSGRIVKTTGDGILAEFPSVVDAVRCAAELQRAMIDREAGMPEDRRIRFRIGINLGDVIVEDDDVFGDGVNIAARLEALAEPGGICISRMVRDQIRDKLAYAFEDLGEQTLKNIARPVRIYALRPEAIANVPAAGALSIPPISPLPVAPRLSIVVLPFTNLSNDPEQKYFADGITEDLTTDLSRIGGSFVIDRNTAFTYIDPATGRLGPVPTINGNILHWGLALEYSTLYLTDRFTGGPPKEEPLHQFVPLVEFAFDTPIGRGFGHKTAGTANPGLSYVAETWQLAAEAILPMNREAGRGVGARIQLLLFLDDLVPTLFGKPLLSQ